MPYSAQDLLYRKFSLLVTVFIFRPSPLSPFVPLLPSRSSSLLRYIVVEAELAGSTTDCPIGTKFTYLNRAYTRQKCLASTFAPRVAMNLLVPNASVEWYSGTRAHDLVPIPRMMLSISWDCARLVHQGSGTRLIRGLQARRMQWHFRCDIRE